MAKKTEEQDQGVGNVKRDDERIAIHADNIYTVSNIFEMHIKQVSIQSHESLIHSIFTMCHLF